MVALYKTEEKGGENSYEMKIKKVLQDLKAKPSTRANRDWDLTEKNIKRRKRNRKRNGRKWQNQSRIWQRD